MRSIARAQTARSEAAVRFRWGSRPMATTSATVKSNSADDSWGSAASTRAAARGSMVWTSSPSSRTAPPAGRSARYTLRSRVDLPLPLGPTSPTNAPLSTASRTSSTSRIPAASIVTRSMSSRILTAPRTRRRPAASAAGTREPRPPR